MLLIFILILIYVYLLYHFYNKKNKQPVEEFDDSDDYRTHIELSDPTKIGNIKIFTNIELSDYLIKNEDKYYNSFSELDLKVRKINNLSEYTKIIEKSCQETYLRERLLLINTIKKANNLLKHYKMIGFDGDKASKMKWEIGIINGTEYEFGLPHTRGNVIILPKKLINDFSLLNILIHEKIHTYQKMYKEDTKIYLDNNKFKIHSLKINNPQARANPDLDEYLYTNSNNELMIAKYNDNPKSIIDVQIFPINDNKYEHPLEFMAYTIEEKITSKMI